MKFRCRSTCWERNANRLAKGAMIWQWRSPDPDDADMHLVMGRLAQLVERFVYTEDVGGSSPSSPTIISMQCRNVYPDLVRFSRNLLSRICRPPI